MSPATGNGENMMDLLHQRDAAFFQTYFTERVLSCIPIPDAFPGAPISFIDVWASPVSVVLLPSCLLVLGAVLPVRQFGAAWIRARTFGF